MKVDITTYHVSYVMYVCCLMTTLCEGLGDQKVNGGEKKDLHNHNNHDVTLSTLNIPVNTNATNMTQNSKDLRFENGTVIKGTGEANATVTEKFTDQPHETPLPIQIMVASPAVAVGIFIFICVAYKWHTVQLDARAKELAAQMTSGECPSPCIPCSPCHNTQRLIPPSHSMNSASQFHSDSDLFEAKRKGLRTPSPILLAPPGQGNRRGSSWSALSDQEVISHSPRRHSTFLL